MTHVGGTGADVEPSLVVSLTAVSVVGVPEPEVVPSGGPEVVPSGGPELLSGGAEPVSDVGKGTTVPEPPNVSVEVSVDSVPVGELSLVEVGSLDAPADGAVSVPAEPEVEPVELLSSVVLSDPVSVAVDESLPTSASAPPSAGFGLNNPPERLLPHALALDTNANNNTDRAPPMTFRCIKNLHA